MKQKMEGNKEELSKGGRKGLKGVCHEILNSTFLHDFNSSGPLINKLDILEFNQDIQIFKIRYSIVCVRASHWCAMPYCEVWRQCEF